MASRKFKITLAYDGTPFGGWQVQSNHVGIQDLVEQALSTVLHTPTRVVGSGRTDAGVHAWGQTAHFTTVEAPPDPGKVLLSCNALLPPTIRLLSLDEVPSTFHARYSAISKVYHYHLYLDPVADPFRTLYCYKVPHPVNTHLLEEAATLFLGEHDFAAFSHKAKTGSAARNSIRTIYRLDCCKEEGGLRLEVEGNGFLYKMVRNIVGTLLDISRGKLQLYDLPDLFAGRDRKKSGATAPAHALFLAKVVYPKFLQDSLDA